MAETPSIPPIKCPVCRKPAAAAYQPFCSKRCADVDLGRWFTGTYQVPGIDGEADGGELPEDSGGTEKTPDK